MYLQNFSLQILLELSNLEKDSVVLYKLNEDNPSYRAAFNDKDILSFDIYGQDDNRVNLRQ